MPNLAIASAIALTAWLAATVRACAGQADDPAQRLVPEAAARLDEADRALFRGDAAAAQAAYGRVLSGAPGCRPALWGRAIALLRLGRDYEALPVLDRAVGESATASACDAAARALLAGTPGPDRRDAARRYWERAVAAEPGPVPDARAEAAFRLARQTGRDEEAMAAWRGLVAFRPELYADAAPSGPSAPRPTAAAPAGAPANGHGDWDLVLAGLAASLALGVAWAIGIGVLFGVGDLLSRAALRLIDRSGGGVAIPPGQGLLRLCYRTAILAAALYFYGSVAVLFLVLTAAPAGLLYGLATTTRVPGGLVPLMVPMTLAWAALVVPLALSLRARWAEMHSGRPVDEASAPGLWRVAREVAEAVGTRPVDEILLVVDTRIGVSERGRPRDLRRGRAIRSLQLGMAAFDGFSAAAFRAVLAHEYAHILHRDTARPRLASRLEARLARSLGWMSFWGGDAWWNLGWCFVSMYARFFARISRAAERLSEIHADRVAVLAYGPGASADGLRHSIRRQVEYQDELRHAVREALGTSATGPTMLLRNRRAIRRRAVVERIRAEMDSPAHADHSHPTPARRLHLIEAIGRERPSLAKDPGAVGEEVDGDLWSLFADPERARVEAGGRFEAQVQYELDAQYSFFTAHVIPPLTAAIHDDAGGATPYRRRAEAYCNLGEWHASLKDLDAALDRDPRDAEIRYARGSLRMATGDLHGAGDDLRDALRIALGDLRAAAHAALGDLSVASGDLGGAIEEFGRSLAINPLQPDILLKRGEARRRVGSFPPARSDFTEAARLDPGSVEARLGLALVHQAEGRRDRAISVAEEALALDDGWPDAHLRLAELLIGGREGPSVDPSRALAHARKAVMLAGGSGTNHDDILLAHAVALADEASNLVS